ncbi:MAG: hypothetical protein MK209_00200 [Planctomycetes bacterium]|nr:hypothetical protein [Planctomycetota bacterium]
MNRLTPMLKVPDLPVSLAFSQGWLGFEFRGTVLVPRREAFYGADEIGVRTPDGATLVLVSFASSD